MPTSFPKALERVSFEHLSSSDWVMGQTLNQSQWAGALTGLTGVPTSGLRMVFSPHELLKLRVWEVSLRGKNKCLP